MLAAHAHVCVRFIFAGADRTSMMLYYFPFYKSEQWGSNDVMAWDGFMVRGILSLRGALDSSN